MEMASLRAALMSARDASGFSQAELARRMGTSQPAIARAESGTGSLSLEWFERFAAATGEPISLQFPGVVRHPRMVRRLRVRRGLLEISRRRARSGSGSNLPFLLARERTMMTWWADVNRALDPIPHAVVGAVAANSYMPQRATVDIDFAIAKRDAALVESQLEEHGWTRLGALGMVAMEGSSWSDGANNTVDVLYLPPAWGPAAIKAAQGNLLNGMPTVTLPYLALMKLLASRTIDTGDLSRMLGHQTEAVLGEVRSVVRRFARPEDVQDLKSIIELGRLEYGIDPGTTV